MSKKRKYTADEYSLVFSSDRLPHLQQVLATKRKRRRGLPTRAVGPGYYTGYFHYLPSADGSVLDSGS